MERAYWQRQSADEPLFPNILWSRPEHKQGAGKLLIVGGSSVGFAAVGEAYRTAETSGAGTVHTLLPDSLRKSVGLLLEEGEYAPSTPSGSFATSALQMLVGAAAWSDMVLLAGDLGRNSETAVLLEKFTSAYYGPLTVTKDAVDYFYNQPQLLLNRPDTCIVLSLAQLQKMAISIKFPTPFLLSMGMLLLIDALHEFTKQFPVTIIVKELEHIVVAHHGQVTSTKLHPDKEIWRVATAARASVFWMQNPSKPLEAVTSSLYLEEKHE